MSRSVLVIGEALVDLIEENDDDDGVAYRPRFGGSPLNVAVGAARLGADVLLATALGADSFGRRLRAFLGSEDVGVLTTPQKPAGTCLAVAARVGGSVEYEYFGDAAAMLDIGPIPSDRIREAAVLHAGSTALLGPPVLATTLEAYAVPGPYRTMDPNPRPSLIEDRATYQRRIERVMGLVDLVKLSREDAEYLFPGLSDQCVAHRILELGAQTVLITNAERDTLVATANGVSTVPVPRITAVDPTGAGDSFMASVIADLAAEGIPADLTGWEHLAHRANAAASITCAAMGGADSMPNRAALTQRLSEREPQVG
jgi:fructokinase